MQMKSKKQRLLSMPIMNLKIIKQAKTLSEEEVKAKKDELPTENLYDNMNEEERKEVQNIVRGLKGVAYSARHARKIILLKYRIYI